jgi:NitT/TauT family transport system substrate-binding protein
MIDTSPQPLYTRADVPLCTGAAREEVPMSLQQAEGWTRRRFLGGVTWAGTAGLLSLPPRPTAAEPPPETTRIRLVQVPTICQAPQYVAEELLRGEGFTDLQYVKKEGTRGIEIALAVGEVDINMHFAAPTIVRLDAGDPILILAGAISAASSCSDPRGSVRSATSRGRPSRCPCGASAEHVFLASMVAYIGVDPRHDLHWVTHPYGEAMRLLAEEQIDALLALPPRAQELRAKQIGRLIVNSAVDRPWSQYFCCMVLGNREFVQKHPMATKRALRAILKAADLCALEPAWAARFMVEGGYTLRYDYALESVRELPYGQWREYSPEDTIRFYALRLHEAGMIASSPQKIIAQGTDWRFLNELKKELKG